jgi:hypothetical protein
MKWRKVTALLVVLMSILLTFLSVAWFLLPDPYGLIPIQIRARLPDDVVSLLTTPIPEGLPAPLTTPVDEQPIILPFEIEFDDETQTPIASRTLTAQLLEEDTLPETFTPSASPTLEQTATATPTQTPVPSATPTLAPRVVLDGLEIIPQHFNNCGPANLTVVLNFYDLGLQQTTVGEALKPHYDDRNVSPHELTAFVNDQTVLHAETYSGGDIDLLKRLIESGFPVIIERGLYPSESIGWMGHYLTLFGYDDLEQEFLSMDTYLGPWDSSGRAESYESIEAVWEHFNNTFIVVHDPEDSLVLSQVLGNNYESPNTMWQSAAVKSQSKTEQEPGNAYAWFNLGSSLTKLGELSGAQELYENAALAFDRAREIGLPWRMLWYQFTPYVAYLNVGRTDEVLALTISAQDVEETHLFRGHALLADGDSAGAEQAYRRALQINPNYVDALDALASLSQ